MTAPAAPLQRQPLGVRGDLIGVAPTLLAVYPDCRDASVIRAALTPLVESCRPTVEGWYRAAMSFDLGEDGAVQFAELSAGAVSCSIDGASVECSAASPDADDEEEYDDEEGAAPEPAEASWLTPASARCFLRGVAQHRFGRDCQESILADLAYAPSAADACEADADVGVAFRLEQGLPLLCDAARPSQWYTLASLPEFTAGALSPRGMYVSLVSEIEGAPHGRVLRLDDGTMGTEEVELSSDPPEPEDPPWVTFGPNERVALLAGDGAVSLVELPSFQARARIESARLAIFGPPDRILSVERGSVVAYRVSDGARVGVVHSTGDRIESITWRDGRLRIATFSPEETESDLVELGADAVP